MNESGGGEKGRGKGQENPGFLQVFLVLTCYGGSI